MADDEGAYTDYVETDALLFAMDEDWERVEVLLRGLSAHERHLLSTAAFALAYSADMITEKGQMPFFTRGRNVVDVQVAGDKL